MFETSPPGGIFLKQGMRTVLESLQWRVSGPNGWSPEVFDLLPYSGGLRG